VPTDQELLQSLETSLVTRLPALLEDVRSELSGDWPDYAEFLDTDLEGIRDGAANMFLHRLVEMASTDPAEGSRRLADETMQAVFEQIGRMQWQQGQDLTRLLTAYQIGARVAWRHVAETAHELALSPTAIAVLAESVFDFVNDLSQASTSGFVLAQGDDARSRDRYRAELGEILLAERSTASVIRAAADRARWTLPERVALVLAIGTEEQVGRLGSYALPVRHGDLVGAVVEDPAVRRGQLAQALSGAGAVVGPAVTVEVLSRTVDLCQTGLALVASKVLTGDPVFLDENLDTIIVHRDERLLTFLRQQVLAPLADLPRGSRDRLTATLCSWLRHQGDRVAVADDLHIHPQTVSYRLGRLRELFGDALDDPRERSRLMLAINW